MHKILATSLAFIAMWVITQSARGEVFQFRSKIEYNRHKSTALLWIPHKADRVRGVVFCGKIMEQSFARSATVRAALAEEKLALVFLPNWGARAEFISILNELADVSGYGELAAAPVMFVGHAAGGPPIAALAAQNQDRCFGLIQYRGGQPGGEQPVPPGMPTLMMMGQFDEYGGVMRHHDGTEQWEPHLQKMAAFRKANPANLGLALVEPGAGHFAWSQRNLRIASLWITKVAAARIPKQWTETHGPPKLLAIDHRKGWLTDLNLKAESPTPAAAFGHYAGDKTYTNWCIDKQMAKAVTTYHRGLTGKADQFLTWKDPHWVDAGVKHFFTQVAWDEDGRTFTVKPAYATNRPSLEKDGIPIWPHPGAKSDHSNTPIRVKSARGPITKVDHNRFRIAFNSLSPPSQRLRAVWLAYSEGDSKYRYTELIGLLPRGFSGFDQGEQQEIDFPPIDDMRRDVRKVKLGARSSLGLPISYYVAVGPARVEGHTLQITEFPPRAKRPVTIEVVAYQFGRGGELPVQSAPTVSMSFRIH